MDAREQRARWIVDGSFGPAVVVTVDSPPSPRTLESFWRAGADLVEYRVDLFSDEQVQSLLPLPTPGTGMLSLLTVRSPSEGGGWSGSETKRFERYSELVAGFDFVDVELASAISSGVTARAHDEGVHVILSAHRFGDVFSFGELDDMISKTTAVGGDLLKVACRADIGADYNDMARWLLEKGPLPVAVVLMGGMGPLSRCTFPTMGSRLTYCHGDMADPAPGSLSLGETADLLYRLSPAFVERKRFELRNQS